MLSEFLLASISSAAKSTTPASSGTGLPPVKDASIFRLAIEPNSRDAPTIYKSSLTGRNGLAASQSHIFAAQLQKAVINVYNVEKSNQEAIIPLPEKVTAIATAGDLGEYVIIGSESGDVLIWESFSGRVVKAEQGHIQKVTAIVVDPSNQFFLTGSSDSTVLVWSLLSLLGSDESSDAWQSGETRVPIQNFTLHRAAISAISIGHSTSHTNFAVSISEDRTALIWQYTEGTLLRTYLLDDIPRSIAVDPADRAIYLGYESGAIQLLELHGTEGTLNALNGSEDTAPIQPSPSSYWTPPSLPSTNDQENAIGATLSLILSYDGTRLVSGHESGRIGLWDIGQGEFERELYTLPGPVTNLIALDPSGFADESDANHKIHQIVKPKIDLKSVEDTVITTELVGQINNRASRAFSFSKGFLTDITPETFSGDTIWESLIDQYGTSEQKANLRGNKSGAGEDFISLDDESNIKTSAAREIELLKEQLDNLKKTQRQSFIQLSNIRRERDVLVQRLHSSEDEEGDEEDEEEEEEDEE